MKTLVGRCESSKEISLSKATKILTKFVSADNGASQAINAYLRRASKAFVQLNQLHKELKPSQSHRKNRRHSHITDDSDRVVGSSVRSRIVDVKSENENEFRRDRNVDVKSENELGRDRNVDGNSAQNDLELSQELNGSVVSGSEKRGKKDKKEQNGIELSQGSEGGTEEGKKQKREKKKKTDKNLEVENANEQEQQKEIEKNVSNNGRVENGGLVASQDFEIRSKKRNEAGSEKAKMQMDKNSEVENAKGQEQQKEAEKKLSNGVKSENGGSIGPQNIEIKSEKKHEAGSENKLNVEEVKTEKKKKKRKNQDSEERSEDRSGEHSKKKMKRKHEG